MRYAEVVLGAALVVLAFALLAFALLIFDLVRDARREKVIGFGVKLTQEQSKEVWAELQEAKKRTAVSVVFLIVGVMLLVWGLPGNGLS